MQIFRKQQQYIWSLIGGKYFLIWNNPFIVYSILIQNMGNIGKGFSILLVVILAASNLMIIESASAQTIPKPSVPEFRANYVTSQHSETTINPYTGKSVTQQINNSTIEISITNQQYTYSNGSTFYLYYNIRVKGHFEEKWKELYSTVRLLPNYDSYRQNSESNVDAYKIEYLSAPYLPWPYSPIRQSSSQYTVFSMPATDYPSGGQLEFQVKAMVGHESTYFGGVSENGMGGENLPSRCLRYVKRLEQYSNNNHT